MTHLWSVYQCMTWQLVCHTIAAENVLEKSQKMIRAKLVLLSQREKRKSKRKHACDLQHHLRCWNSIGVFSAHRLVWTCLCLTCYCGDRLSLIIGGKPEVMSAKWDLAEIFLLTFPGFTVWAVTVTVPPGNQRTEGRAGAAEYIEIVQFSETSLCCTLSPWPGEAFHGRVFCCDGCERAFWDLLSPWMDQDAALPAASSVHVGGASPSWLRPVQRAAGCSAHPGRHHHRSLVLRPSPASCRQGSSVFLCLQQYLYVIVSFSVSLWAF